jgi:hypothetical protein
MTKSKTGKSKSSGKSEAEIKKDAQAARERELRELIEGAEREQGGSKPPSHESPHDFIERKMREKSKK